MHNAVEESTVQTILNILINLVNLIMTAISLIITSIFSAVINAVNFVVKLLFESVGFLNILANILPRHFYTFCSLCLTCIVVHAIIKKIVG